MRFDILHTRPGGLSRGWVELRRRAHPPAKEWRKSFIILSEKPTGSEHPAGQGTRESRRQSENNARSPKPAWSAIADRAF